MTRKEQFETIMNYYGRRHQMLKAIEELTELAEVLIKVLTKNVGLERIMDEMADVYVMLEQVRILNFIDGKELDDKIDEKLERQVNRIKGGNV